MLIITSYAAVMRRQRSKSNRRKGSTVASGNLWTRKTEIWFGDHRFPNLLDSSDTDDNTPPTEPKCINRDQKMNKKMPTMIPSNQITLNHVPVIPPHLRRMSPRRTSIFKTVRCTASSPTESLSESSSDDESELSGNFVHSYVFRQPQMLLRPSSAPNPLSTTTMFSVVTAPPGITRTRNASPIEGTEQRQTARMVYHSLSFSNISSLYDLPDRKESFYGSEQVRSATPKFSVASLKDAKSLLRLNYSQENHALFRFKPEANKSTEADIGVAESATHSPSNIS